MLKLFDCHHHVDGEYLRDSIVVSISACHVEDPGSIPGRGASLFGLLPPTTTTTTTTTTFFGGTVKARRIDIGR